MSFVEHPFICDGPGCGKRRENDTNHWFIMWEVSASSNPFDLPNDKTGLIVLPWLTEEAMKAGRKHLCGVACALKLFERALTFGTLDLVVASQQVASKTKH